MWVILVYIVDLASLAELNRNGNYMYQCQFDLPTPALFQVRSGHMNMKKQFGSQLSLKQYNSAGEEFLNILNKSVMSVFLFYILFVFWTNDFHCACYNEEVFF